MVTSVTRRSVHATAFAIGVAVCATLACSRGDGASAPAPPPVPAPTPAPATPATPETRTDTIASTPAPTGPAGPLPKGTYHLKIVEIPDTSGRLGVSLAFRALVPAGWTAQGGVVWQQNAPDCAEPATVAWSASSPDDKSSFEIFPTELWQASNTVQSRCMSAQFQDMQSYLTAFVRKHISGARQFQYRPRPDLLEPQRQEIEFKLNAVNTSGTGMRFWPDAGELSFTYDDKGTPMKGIVGGTGRFYLSQGTNPMGGPPLATLVAQTNYTYAASFPVAEFDTALVETMRKSVKPDYRWLGAYSDLLTRIGAQNVRDTKRRAEVIVAAGYALTNATIAANRAAANAAVAKTYADAPVTSGGSDDRAQRERIEQIRGVETYDDPLYGGTVQLDSTYDHAWRVQNSDAYILTNDPNFNPGLYNVDAKPLQVTR